MSLDNYSGSAQDIGFVRFFLVYAKVLKVIRIGVNYKKNKKWWDKQPKQLHVDNKASSEAKLEFWTYVARFGDVDTTSFKDNLHDLSVGDLFDDLELQPCKKLC
jgi:hypothetical protein